MLSFFIVVRLFIYQFKPTDSIRIGMSYFTFGYITAQMEQHSKVIKHFSDALNAYRPMTPSFVATEAIINPFYPACHLVDKMQNAKEIFCVLSSS
jgi:hypothetical protein